MGIISAGNIIVGDQEIQKAKQAAEAVAVQRVVTTTTEPASVVSQPRQTVTAPVALPPKVEEQLPTPSGDHHILVVDGKARKVAKRSQYLLDMMTTEE